MILICDERSGERVCTNIGILQELITGCIETIRKELDDAKCLPTTQTEKLNSIAFFQNELRDLTEMLKAPFDVLVVVEKE